MSIKQISKILELHGINYKVFNNSIYGELVYTCDGVSGSEWENLTNYNYKNLLFWLGY